MSILKLEGVNKSYGKNLAVNDVSFEVPRAGIFGLLGPNGAGKTSLIRIITTIIRADSGTIFLDGEKLNSRHPEQIGYMPEERGLYRKMKVGEHLMYLARLKGLGGKEAKAKLDDWFEKFGIEEWWPKKVEELSKGMQQKIQFIATVMHRPKLLILDEPFSGLDPINTNLIKDEIRKLKEEGISIIFSTHRMEQVEEMCEHILLINKGKKVLEGEMAEVKNRYKKNRFHIAFEGSLPEGIEDVADIVDRNDQAVTVQLQEEDDSNDLLRFFIKKNVHVRSFNEILPSLNEIFIRQVEEDYPEIEIGIEALQPTKKSTHP
ncbi:MAG: ATP-binding cassette domain-containing protein [Saprospiraceae bacterium]|nr:ATP-binding cassette domain-containing protein [Saprospiraceae bacterium]